MVYILHQTDHTQIHSVSNNCICLHSVKSIPDASTDYNKKSELEQILA